MIFVELYGAELKKTILRNRTSKTIGSSVFPSYQLYTLTDFFNSKITLFIPLNRFDPS